MNYSLLFVFGEQAMKKTKYWWTDLIGTYTFSDDCKKIVSTRNGNEMVKLIITDEGNVSLKIAFTDHTIEYIGTLYDDYPNSIGLHRSDGLFVGSGSASQPGFGADINKVLDSFINISAASLPHPISFSGFSYLLQKEGADPKTVEKELSRLAGKNFV